MDKEKSKKQTHFSLSLKKKGSLGLYHLEESLSHQINSENGFQKSHSLYDPCEKNSENNNSEGLNVFREELPDIIEIEEIPSEKLEVAFINSPESNPALRICLSTPDANLKVAHPNKESNLASTQDMVMQLPRLSSFQAEESSMHFPDPSISSQNSGTYKTPNFNFLVSDKSVSPVANRISWDLDKNN